MDRVMGYSVRVPDEATALAVAQQLAQRGHLLVAVRPVPDSPLEGQFVRWWYAHSLVMDPPYDGPLTDSIAENAAVAAIARRQGGRSGNNIGQYPDEAIELFSTDGLVHELDRAVPCRAEADRIRERIVAGQSTAAPSLPAAPGLRCGAFRKPAGELRAATEVVRRLATSPQLAPFTDPGAFGEAGDLVTAIADLVFHQGTPGPDTAGAVPVLAGIAVADGISDFFRAVTLMVLFQMNTAGRRRFAYQADELRGLGVTHTESPDEASARAAVAAELPRLATGAAGHCELTDFLLAALCAAGREADVDLPSGLDDIARQYAGTAQVPAVTLVRAVGTGDESAIRSAMADVRAARPDLVDGRESPHAAAEAQALDLLSMLLESELDSARLPPRRR